MTYQQSNDDLIYSGPVADDATLHLPVAVGDVHDLTWPQLGRGNRLKTLERAKSKNVNKEGALTMAWLGYAPGNWPDHCNMALINCPTTTRGASDFALMWQRFIIEFN